MNNDIEIEYAGLGVAMGNAPDAIKALADVTTTSNEDSVACYQALCFTSTELEKEKQMKYNITRTIFNLCQSQYSI